MFSIDKQTIGSLKSQERVNVMKSQEKIVREQKISSQIKNFSFSKEFIKNYIKIKSVQKNHNLGESNKNIADQNIFSKDKFVATQDVKNCEDINGEIFQDREVPYCQISGTSRKKSSVGSSVGDGMRIQD